MKLRHFHILLILLFALFLCPLLGGYCGPEGLTNIEGHLRDEHGVDADLLGGSNGSNRRNGTSYTYNEAPMVNPGYDERISSLEQSMRVNRDNRQENRKELRDDIQEAKNTALQNVGGDIRTIGHLENNKIPDHKHLEESKCPPCPPCARCPEPSFSCKKVPNYASKTQDHLPRPVLNDFSSFAM